MKALIAVLTLAVSANVFAYSVVDSTQLVSVSPILSVMTSSGGLEDKQAAVVLNDAQEYLQSGNMSSFLSQKIKEVQDLNAGASEADAVDMLVDAANDILSK